MKKMVKKGLITLGLFLAAVISVKAQSKDEKVTTDRPAFLLSVGPEAGIPLGSLKDHYNWTLGGSVQADYAIVKRFLYVNLNAGYTNIFADNTPGLDDLHLIPVKLGLKYYPFSGLNVYVQGQAGVSFITNSSGPYNDKSAAFVYTPQVGYLIPLGKGNYLDAAVKFDGNSKFTDGGSTNNTIGIRIAYAFKL
jgi:hypothetical protein